MFISAEYYYRKSFHFICSTLVSILRYVVTGEAGFGSVLQLVVRQQFHHIFCRVTQFQISRERQDFGPFPSRKNMLQRTMFSLSCCKVCNSLKLESGQGTSRQTIVLCLVSSKLNYYLVVCEAIHWLIGVHQGLNAHFTFLKMLHKPSHCIDLTTWILKTNFGIYKLSIIVLIH